LDLTKSKYFGRFTQDSNQGYVAGNLLFGGRVLQGSYYFSGSIGIELYLLTDSSTLTNFYADTFAYVQQLPLSYILDPLYIVTYTAQGATSEQTCLTNRAQFPYWSGTFDDTDFGYGRTFFCQSGNNIWGYLF
jgi:hypothetical protein